MSETNWDLYEDTLGATEFFKWIRDPDGRTYVWATDGEDGRPWHAHMWNQLASQYDWPSWDEARRTRDTGEWGWGEMTFDDNGDLWSDQSYGVGNQDYSPNADEVWRLFDDHAEPGTVRLAAKYDNGTDFSDQEIADATEFVKSMLELPENDAAYKNVAQIVDKAYETQDPHMGYSIYQAIKSTIGDQFPPDFEWIVADYARIGGDMAKKMMSQVGEQIGSGRGRDPRMPDWIPTGGGLHQNFDRATQPMPEYDPSSGWSEPDWINWHQPSTYDFKDANGRVIKEGDTVHFTLIDDKMEWPEVYNAKVIGASPEAGAFQVQWVERPGIDLAGPKVETIPAYEAPNWTVVSNAKTSATFNETMYHVAPKSAGRAIATQGFPAGTFFFLNEDQADEWWDDQENGQGTPSDIYAVKADGIEFEENENWYGTYINITPIEPIRLTKTSAYQVTESPVTREESEYQDEDFDKDIWPLRRPFYWDPHHETIFVGQPGTHHTDIGYGPAQYGTQGVLVALKDGGYQAMSFGEPLPPDVAPALEAFLGVPVTAQEFEGEDNWKLVSKTAGAAGPLPEGLEVFQVAPYSWVAVVGGHDVGNLAVDANRQMHVNVQPEYQRMGVASELLRAAQARYPELVFGHSNNISDQGLAWGQAVNAPGVGWPEEQAVWSQDAGFKTIRNAAAPPQYGWGGHPDDRYLKFNWDEGKHELNVYGPGDEEEEGVSDFYPAHRDQREMLGWNEDEDRGPFIPGLITIRPHEIAVSEHWREMDHDRAPMKAALTDWLQKNIGSGRPIYWHGDENLGDWNLPEEYDDYGDADVTKPWAQNPEAERLAGWSVDDGLDAMPEGGELNAKYLQDPATGKTVAWLVDGGDGPPYHEDAVVNGALPGHGPTPAYDEDDPSTLDRIDAIMEPLIKGRFSWVPGAGVQEHAVYPVGEEGADADAIVRRLVGEGRRPGEYADVTETSQRLAGAPEWNLREDDDDRDDPWPQEYHKWLKGPDDQLHVWKVPEHDGLPAHADMWNQFYPTYDFHQNMDSYPMGWGYIWDDGTPQVEIAGMNSWDVPDANEQERLISEVQARIFGQKLAAGWGAPVDPEWEQTLMQVWDKEQAAEKTMKNPCYCQSAKGQPHEFGPGCLKPYPVSYNLKAAAANAHVDALDPDAREALEDFWHEHEDLRKECEGKYGHDPIDDAIDYWRSGIGSAEPEHHAIRKAVEENDATMTLEMAKKWMVQELAAAKKESNWHTAMGLRGDLPEGIEFRVEPIEYREGEYDIEMGENPQGIDGDYITAWLGGEKVGGMTVQHGIIQGLEVAPEYRRIGVATALLEHARSQLGVVHHNWDDISDEGGAWAEKTAMGLRGDLPVGIQMIVEPDIEDGQTCTAYLGNNVIGTLSIDAKGNITGVSVEPEYQRMGVADEMKHHLEGSGFDVLHDWENMSQAGAGWALHDQPEMAEEYAAWTDPDPWREEGLDPYARELERQRTGMAEQSGDPELDALIEEFKAIENLSEHPDVDYAHRPDPDPTSLYSWENNAGEWAFGNCGHMANAFEYFLERRGIVARGGWEQTPASMGYEVQPDSWAEQEAAQGGMHTATIVDMPSGTYMVDWTAGQYGYQEFPFVRKLEGADLWQEKWSSMIRLGASVQDLAHETIEEMMGYRDNRYEGHRPPRADIAKMKEAYDMFNHALGTREQRDQGTGEVDAQKAWDEKYKLGELEQELIRIYVKQVQMLVNSPGAKERGWDTNKVFDEVVRFMVKNKGFIGHEDDAKKYLGNALKKYEGQNLPTVYLTIANGLDDLYRRNVNSYKLWPWFVKQVKAYAQKWMTDEFSPPIMNPMHIGQFHVNHLIDITAEAGEVLAKLRAENKSPQGMDVNKMDLPELEKWLMEWKAENRAAESQGQVVYEFPDGFTIQRLMTPEQLQFEGDEMGHCVGGYANEVERGESLIYSLRDKKGEPHATLEMNGIQVRKDKFGKPINQLNPEEAASALREPNNVAVNDRYEALPKFENDQEAAEGFNSMAEVPPYAFEWQQTLAPEDTQQGMEGLYQRGYQDGRAYARPLKDPIWDVVQVQGKSDNRPKVEYQNRIKEWIESLKKDGVDFERSEDWFGNYDDPYGTLDQLEYPSLENASKLDDWHDWYRNEGGYEKHRGDRDEYGVKRTVTNIQSLDLDNVITECAASLLNDYDRDHRWKTSDWKGLADATFHAASEACFTQRQFQEALEHGEAELDGWLMDYTDSSLQYDDEDFRQKVREMAEQENIDLDEEFGSNNWSPWDVVDKHPELEDEFLQVQDAMREEIEKYYSEDAWKYFQRLYDLTNTTGKYTPGKGDKEADWKWPKEAPPPGSLPKQEDFEIMRTGHPANLEMPGTFSKTSSEHDEWDLENLDAHHTWGSDAWGQEEIDHAWDHPASTPWIWIPGEPGKLYVGKPGEYHTDLADGLPWEEDTEEKWGWTPGRHFPGHGPEIFEGWEGDDPEGAMTAAREHFEGQTKTASQITYQETEPYGDGDETLVMYLDGQEIGYVTYENAAQDEDDPEEDNHENYEFVFDGYDQHGRPKTHYQWVGPLGRDVRPGEQLYIDALSIDDDFRRQGYATRLVQELMRRKGVTKNQLSGDFNSPNWPDGGAFWGQFFKTAEVAMPQLAPTLEAMPDINYVLDYDPHENTEPGWRSGTRQSPDLIRDFHLDTLQNELFSNPNISWEEARDWLLEQADETAAAIRKLHPTASFPVPEHLRALAPDTPYTYNTNSDEMQTISSPGHDYWAEWFVERAPAGYRNSRRTASPITNYQFEPFKEHELVGFHALDPAERRQWRWRANTLNARARKHGVEGRAAASHLWAILQRHQGRCAYCERPLKFGHNLGPHGGSFDHVTPLSLGGRGDASNIVPACSSCNQAMATWDTDLNPEMQQPQYHLPSEFVAAARATNWDVVESEPRTGGGFREDRRPGLVDSATGTIYLGSPGDYHDDVRNEHDIWFAPWIELYENGTLRYGAGIDGLAIAKALSKHLGIAVTPAASGYGWSDVPATPRDDDWNLAKTAAPFEYGENYAPDETEYKFIRHKPTGDKIWHDMADEYLNHDDLIARYLGADPRTSYKEWPEFDWHDYESGFAQVSPNVLGELQYSLRTYGRKPNPELEEWARQKLYQLHPELKKNEEAGWRSGREPDWNLASSAT